MAPEVRAWLHDLPHRDRASAVLVGQAIGLLLEAGPELVGDGRPHPPFSSVVAPSGEVDVGGYRHLPLAGFKSGLTLLRKVNGQRVLSDREVGADRVIHG